MVARKDGEHFHLHRHSPREAVSVMPQFPGNNNVLPPMYIEFTNDIHGWLENCQNRPLYYQSSPGYLRFGRSILFVDVAIYL